MSLGLVSYDDSEESENESDCGENLTLNKESSQKSVTSASSTEHVKTNKGLGLANRSENISDDELEPTTNSMNGYARISNEELEPNKSSEKSTNLHLPESKLSLINTDIDIKCLTSSIKKNGPVKITIPSLNEVTDESEPPSKKKLKPSQKGSGLFALLPTPKSSLVPQSVMNKKLLNPATRKPIPSFTPAKNHTPASRVTAAPTLVPRVSSLISYGDSENEVEIESDNEEDIDFFSLESKDKDINPAPIDVDIDIPETSTSIVGNKNFGASPALSLANTSDWQGPMTGWGSSTVQQPSSSQTAESQQNFGYTTSEFMTVSNNDLELDQQAMQQLCGRRDRHKMQEVNLIDVSGDAIMPDSREWLTKQLTEEVVHRPSHKRKDGPTTQQKRKHQITYLAYQAKENELELKNQWSNNRMSRKQTQAKYGF